MYQQLTILGNLGSDPNSRFTPSGKHVTDFSVAVNEKYGDKETATWFKVTCWDKLAEITQQYLTKGRQVMVTGRVKAGAYTDKDGKAVGTLDVTADKVLFVGGVNGNNKHGVATATPDGMVDESEIPF